jgi:C-terminal processing protease CtpA/Prc
MRMAFGLAALLVTIGVIAWIMQAAYLPHTQAITSAQKPALQQAEQLSGHGAMESITVQPRRSGSKLDDLLVTNIVPGGKMNAFYGLQRGDRIVEINDQPLRDLVFDPEDALLQAYQTARPIVILRGNDRLSLPAVHPPTAKPVQASKDPLQQQLDALQRIPGQ